MLSPPVSSVGHYPKVEVNLRLSGRSGSVKIGPRLRRQLDGLIAQPRDDSLLSVEITGRAKSYFISLRPTSTTKYAPRKLPRVDEVQRLIRWKW